jgi:hypothetical protein
MVKRKKHAKKAKRKLGWCVGKGAGKHKFKKKKNAKKFAKTRPKGKRGVRKCR